MKKILLVFGVSAVLVVLLASAALAQTYGDRGMRQAPWQPLVPLLVLPTLVPL